MTGVLMGTITGTFAGDKTRDIGLFIKAVFAIHLPAYSLLEADVFGRLIHSDY